MSPSADRITAARAGPVLAVDRVLCTGHGVCSRTLPDHIRLDEWGYPILDDPRIDPAHDALAVKLCPARALYLRD